jgi:DNA-binding LacI/PurR family transcriptional regulator
MLWGHVIREAQRRNYAQGESFSIHSILRNESGAEYVSPQLVKMFERSQIDGVISVALDDATCDWMRPFNIPVVSYAGSGMWVVFIDEGEMIRLGVDALAKQGCRDIRLWISGNENPPHQSTAAYVNIESERAAFEMALRDNGLACDFGAIRNNRTYAAYPLSREQQGAEAVRDLIETSNGRLPDALMITDDMMTIGVVPALYEAGIRPGIDIKIASQTNKGIPLLSTLAQFITRVEVDPEMLVRTMFEILDGGLSGATPRGYGTTIAPFSVLKPGAA